LNSPNPIYRFLSFACLPLLARGISLVWWQIDYGRLGERLAATTRDEQTFGRRTT
jgi:hypothetical protein